MVVVVRMMESNPNLPVNPLIVVDNTVLNGIGSGGNVVYLGGNGMTCDFTGSIGEVRWCLLQKYRASLILKCMTSNL